jgi:hypothetical protein
MSTAIDVSVPEQVRHNREEQRKKAEQQTRPDIEKQRKETEQQVTKTLNADAIAAIDETEKALNSISLDKIEDAVASLERATGKLAILLARNPDTAFLPVNFAVDIFDTAPQRIDAIRDIAEDVGWALDEKDFPSARVLLHSLMSEIRVRTLNLPLATYPDVLAEAARLLNEKKAEQASIVLLTALNTLVAVDQVTPIPLLLARAAIDQAQSQRESDKQAAHTQLDKAEKELERCKELGYAARDPEYLMLRDSLSDLKKQLKRSNEDTGSAFKKVKEKVGSILKRHSDRQQSQPQACQHGTRDEAKRKESDTSVTDQNSTQQKLAS